MDEEGMTLLQELLKVIFHKKLSLSTRFISSDFSIFF